MILHIPDDYKNSSLNIQLEIEGRQILSLDKETSSSIFSLPIKIQDLLPGTYEVKARLAGEGISEDITGELMKLVPKANAVKIDRLTGGLLVNDLPYFPFGFYCYSPVQTTLPEEEVVKGFNMMSPYQRIESKTREDRKAYLDRCAELGMKVHYNLLSVAGGGGVGSGRSRGQSMSEKARLLKEEIEAFKDHPAILAWYISDEPTGHGADPDSLKQVYQFIKSLDPYHPITIVFMAPMQARRYADAMDIVMADPYPIPNNTPEGVGYITRNLMNEFHGEKPVWIVPQAFGGSEWWGREPSIQELRVMTYLSIANGATGIQYFVRHGLNGFPKSTAAWGMAGQIALETQDIAPFLLEGKVLTDLAMTEQENIHLRSWEKDGQILIMAVNESENPGLLKLQFKDMPDRDAQVLFENRPMEIINGQINDYIDGFGRRVYLLGEPLPGAVNINKRNMILDPGFEDLASPGVPASCYARVGIDRGATYFTDSRVSVEGRHSVRFNSPTANNGSSLGFFPVMVNSGSGYTLSVWARYDSTSFRPETQNFWQRLFHKDPDPNRYFNISLGAIKSETFALSHEWRKYSLTVYIPEKSEESSRINPSLELISQGTAWFDALEMYPDPVIEYGINADSHSFEVRVTTEEKEAEIKYTLDGSIPGTGASSFTSPIQLTKSATFTTGVFIDDKLFNYSSKSFFVHLATGKTVDYFRKYAKQYAGGGEFGLVDGIRGSRNYQDGLWQGFMGNDLVATIDLENSTGVTSVKVCCLQDTRSWIFMPKGITVMGSNDGKDFISLGEILNDVSQKAEGSIRKDYQVSFKTQKFRYIRVTVDNIGICPEWHNGKGQAAYLFVDEIIVE